MSERSLIVQSVGLQSRLPAGLLEQLDTTPWGAELPDGDEEPAIELRLNPRQQQAVRQQEKMDTPPRRRRS